MSSNQSLVPLSRALPAKRQSLPIVARRLLPVASRTLTAAAVGLATEYALRALTNRALASVARPAAPAPRTTRIIVTEFVVIERIRRR